MDTICDVCSDINLNLSDPLNEFIKHSLVI